MALQAKDAAASVDTSTAMFAPQVAGLVAGENIDACAPCHVEADGKVYMSAGSQAGAAPTAAETADSKVDGFSAEPARAGQGVTLLGPGVRMRYASGGLTPGALFYVGTTPGRLDTAPTALGTVAVAKAITATDVVVINRVP